MPKELVAFLRDLALAIIAAKRAITGDTALRLGHWFGVDPAFWINLQAQFDLAMAGRETGEAVRKLPRRADLPNEAA